MHKVLSSDVREDSVKKNNFWILWKWSNYDKEMEQRVSNKIYGGIMADFSEMIFKHIPE